MLIGLYLTREDKGDRIGDLIELGLLGRFVGENNSKEDRGIARPVGADVVPNAHNSAPESIGGTLDACRDLLLVYEHVGNERHETIIAGDGQGAIFRRHRRRRGCRRAACGRSKVCVRPMDHAVRRLERLRSSGLVVSQGTRDTVVQAAIFEVGLQLRVDRVRVVAFVIAII